MAEEDSSVGYSRNVESMNTALQAYLRGELGQTPELTPLEDRKTQAYPPTWLEN